MQLGRGTSERPLGNLHLGARSLHALRKRGITTVGQFADRAITECAGMHGVGAKTAAEIYEAHGALCRASSKGGSVDWVMYARLRKFTILPSKRLTRWSGENFARWFPKAASTAVESQFGPAGLLVFRERLLKPWNYRPTMDTIGLELGVMWETIRKLEMDTVSMFRRILLADDYSGCRFRFRSEFLEPLRVLSAAFTRVRPPIRSIAKCEETFKTVWDVTLTELAGQENILIDILGFRWLHRKRLHYSTRSGRIGAEQMRVVRKELRKTLVRPGSSSVSLRTLVGLMKKKFGEHAPSPDDVRAIVTRMHRGKVRPIIRGSYANRPSANVIANTCERLLRRRGKPLHFSDLCAALNRTGRFDPPLSPKLVAVYLHRDTRFIPISLSGSWALADWPAVETRTITDVAEALLIEAKRPLDDEALFQLIAERRPVGRKSVTPLLHGDKRFRRMPGGLWSLASEGANEAGRRQIAR